MTPKEKFAAWLPDAMRRAGYDIDTFNGKGRIKFATAAGVTSVKVTRWLAATTMPGPDEYDAVAAALGYDDASDMLKEVGIISPKHANSEQKSAVDSPPMAPSEAAERLGFRDPYRREMFLGVVDRLARTPQTPDQENHGGAAADG